MTSRNPLPVGVALLCVAWLSCCLLEARAAPVPESDESRVADYVKALKSKNAAVRKQGAAALGDMGPKAKAAVPALRAALADPDEGVQAAAAAALEKSTPN